MMLTKPVTLAMGSFQVKVIESNSIPSTVPVSVADPYHFDTDPDPDLGCEKIRSGSGSRVNFDTDPDPGKNDTDPDPEKRPKYQENLQKVYEKR